jgi:hypothetical protein
MQFPGCLSDSTADADRGDKFAAYRRLRSLREYVLVSQHERRIDVYTRDGRRWVLDEYRTGERLRLESIRWIGRRTLPPRKPAHELEDLYEDNFEPMSQEERAELDGAIEQSFVDEEAGKLIDAGDALAELRANRF